MDREALGTYKGVFEYMGFFRASGSFQMHGGIQTYGGVQMPPNIWGVNTMPPSVKVTCHYRKLGVFEHMGLLRWTGKHWGHTRGC